MGNRSDLCIISIPGRDRPILAYLDLAQSNKYYKYPLSIVGVSKYSVIETKPKGQNEEEFTEYYAINFVMPTLTHQLEKSSGWLTPMGNFYPCAFDEINLMAEALCIVKLRIAGDAVTLLDRGWAYIKYTGSIKHDVELTMEQLSTIKKLIITHKTTFFSFRLWKEVTRIVSNF